MKRLLIPAVILLFSILPACAPPGIPIPGPATSPGVTSSPLVFQPATVTPGPSPTAWPIPTGSIWTVNRVDQTILRYEPTLLALTASIPIPGHPFEVAVTDNAVWVLDGLVPRAIRIDPETNLPTAEVMLEGYRPLTLVAGNSAVWVGAEQTGGTPPPAWQGSSPAGAIIRIDPASNQVSEIIRTPAPVVDLALYEGNLWAVASGNGFSSIYHIPPFSDSASIPPQFGVYYDLSQIAADSKGVWVTNREVAQRLLLLDPASGALLNSLELTGGSGLPYDLTTGTGGVWVLFEGGNVAHVDAASETLLAVFPVSRGRARISVAGDAVWVMSQEDAVIYRIDPTLNRVVVLVTTGNPLPTPTPTSTPTEYPTEAPLPDCEAAYQSRLSVGMHAVVNDEPPIANRVRADPDTTSRIVGYIQPGEEVSIIGGPSCVNNWVWWKVKSVSQDLLGWTAEGDEDSYWLVPK